MKKRGITCYFDEQDREQLATASFIYRTSINGIVTIAVKEWISRNVRKIEKVQQIARGTREEIEKDRNEKNRNQE